MAKFLMLLYRIVNLYTYFVVMACILLIVPNINPDYPLFNAIFKFAGFYLIPPVMGIMLSPMCVLMVLTLINMGIYKLYKSKYADKEPKIIVLSADEFAKQFNKTDDLKIEDESSLQDDGKEENK